MKELSADYADYTDNIKLKTKKLLFKLLFKPLFMITSLSDLNVFSFLENLCNLRNLRIVPSLLITHHSSLITFFELPASLQHPSSRVVCL